MKKTIILAVLLTLCLVLLISCSPKKQNEEPTQSDNGKATEKQDLPAETDAPSADKSTETEYVDEGEWDTEDMKNETESEEMKNETESEKNTDDGTDAETDDATEASTLPEENESFVESGVTTEASGSTDSEAPTEPAIPEETENTTTPVTPTQPESPKETEIPTETPTTPTEPEEDTKQELGTHYDENEGEWDIVG